MIQLLFKTFTFNTSNSQKKTKKLVSYTLITQIKEANLQTGK